MELPPPPASRFLDLRARADGVYLGNARFAIKGASYFGMETDVLAPHGLWGGEASTTLDAVATTLLAPHDFNLVRVPLAVSAVRENPLVDRSKVSNERALLDAFANRELRYLDVLDYVVRVFAQHQLLVLLDAHVLVPSGPITPLWYDDSSRKDRLKDAWTILATRYAQSWNVVAADLKNEPHGVATWGTGDLDTDWRLAALDLAETVLQLCPRWLIFVEGIQSPRNGASELPCFWGESLQDVPSAPLLELSVPERLVYSPHVYGPDVADQPYFHDANFPANMPSVWDVHFGFVQQERLGPLVIGEWGGKYRSDSNRAWQHTFAAYLETNAIGSIYWCVNPNSGDTEGLLDNDWKTLRDDKLRVLATFNGSPVPVMD